MCNITVLFFFLFFSLFFVLFRYTFFLYFQIQDGGVGLQPQFLWICQRLSLHESPSSAVISDQRTISQICIFFVLKWHWYFLKNDDLKDCRIKRPTVQEKNNFEGFWQKEFKSNLILIRWNEVLIKFNVRLDQSDDLWKGSVL